MLNFVGTYTTWIAIFIYFHVLICSSCRYQQLEHDIHCLEVISTLIEGVSMKQLQHVTFD